MMGHVGKVAVADAYGDYLCLNLILPQAVTHRFCQCQQYLSGIGYIHHVKGDGGAVAVALVGWLSRQYRGTIYPMGKTPDDFSLLFQ